MFTSKEENKETNWQGNWFLPALYVVNTDLRLIAKLVRASFEILLIHC
jgi:hypothetical protein